MSLNSSTSAHLCACGCEKPVKLRQRWYEPACKARQYRGSVLAGRKADGARIHELEEALEDVECDRFELRRRLESLEQAYSNLWEEHQNCPRVLSLDAPQVWGSGDAYAVLGVWTDAEMEAIEGAYKALAKKYHPDRHPGDPVMVARMKALTAAYAEVRRRRGYR